MPGRRSTPPVSSRIRRSDEDGEFYFVIKAANGETLAHSETYRAKEDCVHGASLIGLPIVDETHGG